jgi:hypothetical protein
VLADDQCGVTLNCGGCEAGVCNTTTHKCVIN